MDRLIELRKKADAEYRDLERQAREIENKKALVRFHMAKLDESLAESEKALLHPKRPGDPTSLPVLMESILESHEEGLTVAELLIELKNMGFESTAKNPAANLNTVLYRHRPTKFQKTKDARWYLTKYPTPTPKLKIAGT